MNVKQQLDPLLYFYSQKGDRSLKFCEILAENIPEPYKSLLVHDKDMTPTLETYYRETIHLRILNKAMLNSIYMRKVLLLLDSNEKPVEFGAIRIYIDRFSTQAQKHIVDGYRPLGGVLHSEHIPHSSGPTSYFMLEGTAEIIKALEVSEPTMLYGRCNTIRNADMLPLAEIVEILPALA